MRGILKLVIVWILAISPVEAIAAGLSYRETFDSETAFPTTPEVDELMMGGLSSIIISGDSPIFGADVLIHTFVTDGTNNLEWTRLFAVVPRTVLATTSTAGSDLTLRGTYSLKVISGDGFSAIGVGTQLLPSSRRLSAGLEFTMTLGVLSVSLGVTEFDDELSFQVASDYLPLSASTVSDLLIAPDFVVEMRFDANTQTATAWLEVSGNTFETNPIPLTAPIGQTLEGIVETALTVPVAGVANFFTVELDSLELDADAVAFTPYLNIDIGAEQGVPATTYAAAGSPGVWNSIGVGGPQALDSTGNGPIPATATVFAVNDKGSTPGAGALKGDHLNQCGPSDWRLDLANLPDGAYRVLVYAPADGSPTYDMEIEGKPLASLPGEPGTNLTEGVSWDWALAAVQGGSLTIEESAGGPCDTGLAGVQIEGPITLPEPASTIQLGFGILGLMLTTARRRRSKGPCEHGQPKTRLPRAA